MDQKKRLAIPLNPRRGGLVQSSQHETADSKISRKYMNSANGGSNNNKYDRKNPAQRGASNNGASRDQLQKNRKEKNWRNTKEIARANMDMPKYSANGQDPQGLLNFQYAPMRGSVSFHQGSGYNQPTSRRRRTNTFNKETFLQANCHFVVKDTGDYTIHAADPDILVDWDLVELIYMPTHELVQCPICLYPPTTAKITRCGHVYCWKCILHYLHLGEKTWRKCPICHESIHPDGLKSVVACQKKKYERNSTITLTLMKRSKNNLRAHPEKNWQNSNTDADFAEWDGDLTFQQGCTGKLMLASSSAVLQHILATERTSLEAQREEAVSDQTGEECFIDAALKVIEDKERIIEQNCKAMEETSRLLNSVKEKEKLQKSIPFDDTDHQDLASILEQSHTHNNSEDPFSSDDDEVVPTADT